MGLRLRVLIVEDSIYDSKLLLLELGRGGYEPVFERVDTAEAMGAVLDSQDWDIVISDYVMPRFSGMAALKLLKDKGLDIPFILMSGQIGEELAAQAMKAGAHDYILKGNSARLIPAVERELREAIVRREKREADEALRKAHEELRKANAELERRVEERTAELATANEELQSQNEEIQAQAEELHAQNEELEMLASELARANDALDKEQARLRAIIEQAPEGIVIADEQCHIVMTNPAADKLYARPVPVGENFDGRGEVRLFHTDGTPFDPRDRPLTRAALDGMTCMNVEMQIKWPDGQTRSLLVNTAPIKDAQGQVAGAVGVFQDITERKRLEAEREDFLRMVSHDLRSPLTSIRGNAQLLWRSLAEVGTERQQRSAEAIIVGTRRMEAMIQDLVDSIRLETGQISFERQPLNLSDFVSALLEQSVEALDVRRIASGVSPDLPPVLADANRLERVLVNLLSNACKYSSLESRVRISAQSVEDEVVISVADTGAGIAPEDQPRIFERYFRAKSVDRIDGLGIGLYITKMLVEGQGGRIWVESEPGKGSTFRFTLPTG